MSESCKTLPFDVQNDDGTVWEREALLIRQRGESAQGKSFLLKSSFPLGPPVVPITSETGHLSGTASRSDGTYTSSQPCDPQR